MKTFMLSRRAWLGRSLPAILLGGIALSELPAAEKSAGPGARVESDFNSDGVKIHYVVEGQGEPVILIHGLYASALTNWELPGTVSELAKHYQVIALDNRGHGQSDKPQQDGEYGVKMVEDVIRLMDHLHLRKAHVVGYSLGGMITMKLVTLHPDRVSSAVLGGMGWLPEGSPLQKFWDSIKGANRGGTPPACLRGMAGLAVTEDAVKAVRVPVKIVVGDQDPCRLLYVQPLQKVRPDWPTHLVPGAGHLLCVVKPEFKKDLVAALARDAAPAAK